MQPTSSPSLPLKSKDQFSLKILGLRFCVIAPCLLLFLIIGYIYLTYLFLYLIPLISDSYWFDNNPNAALTEAQFPLFKEVLRYQDLIILKVAGAKERERQNENQGHFGKGLIFIICEHYLVFWLLFSLIRTIKTAPGSVPLQPTAWSIKISAIIAENRRKEIKNLRKLKKISNQAIVVRSESQQSFFPSIFSQIQRTEERKLTENDQGRQGTNSNSEKSFVVGEDRDEDSAMLEQEFSERERLLIEIKTLESAKKKDNLRFCQHCRQFKPMRAHHCQQCMKCVLKMDHHCQWLLNCIGFRNYKYFMNMLIYADLNLIFILSTFMGCMLDAALNPYIDGYVLYVILFTFLLTMILAVLLVGFTIFHFWLILTGRTSLEYCEKWKKDGPEKKVIVSFNEGVKQNFLNVFNKNPLLWFFPFNPNTDGDGLFLEFEKMPSGEL